MSDDQIQALINAAKSDSILEGRLRAAAELDADAVVAIAKEAGFAVTKEEVIKAQENQSEELTEEELLAVAGGFSGYFGARTGSKFMQTEKTGAYIKTPEQKLKDQQQSGPGSIIGNN